MFKHITFTLAALALLASCSVKDDRLDCLTPVTIHVSDFRISQEDFPDTKATAIGSYNGVKAITLALYDTGSEEVYKATQLKGATLYHKEVRNVPFRRNRCTRLTGSIYSATTPASTAFQLNTEWADEEALTF